MSCNKRGAENSLPFSVQLSGGVSQCPWLMKFSVFDTEEWAAHIQRGFHNLQLQAGCSEAANEVAAAAQTLSLKVQGGLCAEQIFQGYRPVL